VRIWDSGTYDWEEWTDQQIVFTVHGAQTGGRFNLIRFKRGKPNKWLIIKVVVWGNARGPIRCRQELDPRPSSR
jgi:hypothetical protein